MAKRRRKVSEEEIARRRVLAERIDRRVEQISKEVAKAGPPKETIVETLRRLRGGSSDGRS